MNFGVPVGKGETASLVMVSGGDISESPGRRLNGIITSNINGKEYVIDAVATLIENDEGLRWARANHCG